MDDYEQVVDRNGSKVSQLIKSNRLNAEFPGPVFVFPPGLPSNKFVPDAMIV
jgi:hypothetical protein